MTKFSVLLPVYIADKPEFFIRAIRSATIEQTLPPTQIVVVCDGPVHPDIQNFLRKASSDESTELIGKTQLTVIKTPQNRGLSHALNLGLAACKYDTVARADADDISLPNRFEKQIPYFKKGYDLVGSALTEFNIDESLPGLIRKMPQTASEIKKVARLRDPFNHPTVVYRASKVLACGGYEHVNHMEDYWLFARMIQMGVRCANIPESLVLYRVGDGAYCRRGGLTLFRSEYTLQRKLRSIGLTSNLDFFRNIAIRCGYRLIPSSLRKSIYQFIGRAKWFR
ncbi:glycosyltransferase [Arcanobacterium hippocoleae]|uniref:Glycosyltransferase involved in cell wall biosynthesis n=1 Tax=Arcanobacterium hippocoleae TaxID=149017 RepID=A0ABU1SZU6_9ACTO|nr:glycosyltransferase [Arcanobacterium hippocoleae]MDR6938569.1 glycosyltransferase involved in cell wall biosynthesis [Arcanobacterium hippocoleae]